MWAILSIVVENKPGILFKVTHLFRSRNFNIDSISVGVTENPEYSRMTITTIGDEKQVAQIVKQLDKMIDTVEYGKSRGLQVEFSAEDASRTDREFLKKVFGEVAKAGADRVNIPDTVGYSTPEYMAEITRDTVEVTKLPVSVHCHNDFGLAVANALSGIHAGASCAHVTINGIGERAGNASLEELVMALKCLPYEQNYETHIKSELIYDTSRYISKIVGIKVQPNKAIVGDNAWSRVILSLCSK